MTDILSLRAEVLQATGSTVRLRAMGEDDFEVTVTPEQAAALRPHRHVDVVVYVEWDGDRIASGRLDSFQLVPASNRAVVALLTTVARRWDGVEDIKLELRGRRGA